MDEAVDTAGDTSENVRLARPERRRQLLSVAREVFVESGYHATSMGDIADRAGVSKPVLYQHFEGKMDLYHALLDEQVDQMVELCAAALRSTTDNHARVVAMNLAFFRFVDREDSAFRLVFESDLVAEPRVRERIEAGMARMSDAVAQAIAADTDMSRPRAWLLGTALVGQAHVAARAWLAAGRPLALEDAASLLAQAVWYGIRGFPAR